jgi:hypothetical protein
MFSEYAELVRAKRATAPQLDTTNILNDLLKDEKKLDMVRRLLLKLENVARHISLSSNSGPCRTCGRMRIPSYNDSRRRDERKSKNEMCEDCVCVLVNQETDSPRMYALPTDCPC